jgi:hypothetical protein
MYRRTGSCRFLGFFGLWKISNLPVFSAPWRFDSVPGHHIRNLPILLRLKPSGPSLSSGFRLRAHPPLTPAKRLKFDSVPGHHHSKALRRFHRFSPAYDSAHDKFTGCSTCNKNVCHVVHSLSGVPPKGKHILLPQSTPLAMASRVLRRTLEPEQVPPALPAEMFSPFSVVASWPGWLWVQGSVSDPG